jgi:hypothetical protein
MQKDNGSDIPELSIWTDAITEATQKMYQSAGCDPMGGDGLELVVDVSRLLPKIAEITDALYSSQITAGQLNRLIQSVYILPEKNQPSHCLAFYADMESLSDIKPLH